VCRVSSLQAEQFDEVCALAVPSDLSEDLANHFADYDLDCGLKRPVLADKDFLLFAKEINPARIEAVLKKWDGSPLLPRQKP